MSDEPRIPRATESGFAPNSHEGPSSEVLRWIAPERLTETLLPGYFHPKYDAVDSFLTDSTERWVRLGDLVQEFSPRTPPPPDSEISWFAEGSPTSLQISEMQPHQSTPAGSFLLPNQAILLQLTAKGSLGVEYWDSSLYPGGGAASPDLLALTTVAAVDPAWIAWELRTNELVELQLDRARLGATIPRIDRSLVLRLCLPLPGLNEQVDYSNTLRGIIRENQSLSRAQKNIEAARRSQREFVVTGASLQDRLRQFEDYLNSEKWITPGSVFRLDQVEGTPRFTVRPIGQARTHTQSASPLPPDVTASQEWLDWCSNPGDPWRVFNSFLDKEDLPPNILAQIVAKSESQSAPRNAHLAALPTFDVWREVYRSVWDLQGALTPSDWSQMLKIWRPVLSGRPTVTPTTQASDDGEPRDIPESTLISFVREVSRPILALKAVYEEQVARIFLIVGPDQTDDPLHAVALLKGYASILSENLNRATHFTAEAAQKESIRRLSWLRHHLNGPLGIASNALDDIKIFLKHNPEVAAELVPNTAVANKMASRPGRELSDYTLKARLAILEREIKNLKGLSEQIKQLSEIGPNEEMAELDVAKLLRERAQHCRDLVEGLTVKTEMRETPTIVVGNIGQLSHVFDELLFNACREFKEHLTADPCVIVSAAISMHHVTITVGDNALPTSDRLPKNPFDEGVTRHRGAGGGTGLGLTIVREIVTLHGGRCSLEENIAPDETRLPGVTFTLVLPLNRGLAAL